MPVQASAEEREQMLRAVEVLLTDPRYANRWWGWMVCLSEPRPFDPFPQENEGVWIQVTDKGHAYTCEEDGPEYVIVITTDVYGFDERLWSEATKELYQRWEAEAKRSVRAGRTRGRKRARTALRDFTKERAPDAAKSET